LARVRERAEKSDRRHETNQPVARSFAEHNGQTKQGRSIPRKSGISRREGGSK